LIKTNNWLSRKNGVETPRHVMTYKTILYVFSSVLV